MDGLRVLDTTAHRQEVVTATKDTALDIHKIVNLAPTMTIALLSMPKQMHFFGLTHRYVQVGR